MSEHAEKVLAHVSQADYEPATLKALSRRFKIAAEDYADFRNAVKALIKQGKLDLSRDKTLRPPTTKGQILGTFRRSPKGFGFVRPLKSKDRKNDIFIPAKYTSDASTGDEVAVRVAKRSKTPGMNDEGRIVRVIERASGIFVGTYYEDEGFGFVKVDGTTFHAPIFVGDPGAKGAKPGDKVALEMVRFPTPDWEGEGVITEVLGPRGQPGVDTLTVIRAFNIPDVFDDDILLEAREQARAFNENEISGRLDLRDTLTVTIDPATARDFDDAITLERDDRGYWTLGVHIADVSYFVPPNSALDASARKRGTSVYLPDRVIPMLPEILSNSLASLQQGHVRYTLSAFMEFNEDGVRTDRRFARSVIKVNHRFTYEQAYEAMMNPEKPIEGLSTEVHQQVVKMLELAMILRRRRFKRGALQLTMPEVEVDLGDQGEVVGAHLAPDDESHQVIEEFMLAANEAVAEHLREQGAGFLRRGHADPDEHKLREFAEFVRTLGYSLEDFQSRFELQRVLDESAQQPERHAVHYGLLRSMKQANYTPEHEEHYALASSDYCHFTSPIRRYPDLQVHRTLCTLLEGKRPRSDADELLSLAEHCNRTERRAEAAERELIKIKLLTYMTEHVGEAFHAIIIGVEDFGFFCQLVELPIEGLVHITSLHDDYYYLERETHTLIGRRAGKRFRLGDKIEVRVARVDIDRRELDLVLEADAPPALPPSKTEGRAVKPKPKARRQTPPEPRADTRKPRKKGGRKRRS